MGIETATFHILTPYPGCSTYDQFSKQNRLLTKNWDLYDTRHCVFIPKNMTPDQLEEGYWRSYKKFYKLSSIWKSCKSQQQMSAKVKHLAYAVGWKRSEWIWSLVIKAGLLPLFQPLLESILDIGCRRTKTSIEPSIG